MQGEFEKKVQAKLEQLNMEPSAPVWEQVALRIRPEKKRRRVFVWLFLCVVLLGGGWLIATQQTESPGATTSQNVPTKPATVPSPDVSTMPEEKPSITKSRIVKSNIAPHKMSHPASGVQKEMFFKNSDRPKQAGRKPGLEERFSKQPALEMKSNNRNVSGSTDRSFVAEEKKEIIQTPVLLGGETAESKKTLVDPSAAAVVDDTAIQSQKPEVEHIPAKDSSASRKKMAAAGKWKKQLTLQGGWSHFALDPNPGNYASYSSGVPVSNNSNFQPATYNAGGSFAIGFGMEKTFNPHFQFSVALQYAYYSVHSTIGGYRRIDTTVSYDNTRLAVQGYYGNSQATDYTTRMHFIELPVSLSYQPLADFPLQVLAGLSYGRLFESNALTRQTGYNIYYYNEANNNKDYFNLLASLQYRVVNKPGFRLGLGPQVQYSTNSIQKEYSGKKPHLFFAGLKTTFSF